MTSFNDQILRNVENVRKRIALAEERSGRKANSVKMVAVTKYSSCNDGFIPALFNAGCFDFGENRPQHFLDKIEAFRDSAHWHFIGSLQRNKVRRILPFVSLIHSVDSVKLAETIDRILYEEGKRQSLLSTESSKSTESLKLIESPNQTETAPASFLLNRSFPAKVSVLLEVNISHEDQKHGFQPDELLNQLGELFSLTHLNICGLMGMGGLSSDEREIRQQFGSLRKLLERIRHIFPQETQFRELSMGMSDDFEIAIEEGSTIIRLGSILLPR
ncbi:MAG: YggS family pyridoxal phosphate enzyme [Planctomycetia bacterium]|nr:YggS family pyridoxal phosphate enzyme [Planctomycetia bacterium]